MSIQTRQPQGRPTGGQFSALDRTDAEIALTPTPGPFVFNRDYDDYEQVRPYFDDYMARRRTLDADGSYPYNDSFTGQIPSLAGTDPKQEQTAIYMLQTLHSLDELAVKVDAFLANGGREITNASDIDGELRGTVVKYGFYMGGTGWSEHKNARLRADAGLILLTEYRKRFGRFIDGKILFREDA